jgi:hypothetical protein
MARPAHQRSIWTFAVDEVLEHMRYHARNGHADEHAVSLTANFVYVWMHSRTEPKQTDYAQQQLLIGEPGHDPQGPLARWRCGPRGALADRNIEPRGGQFKPTLVRHWTIRARMQSMTDNAWGTRELQALRQGRAPGADRRHS